MCSIVSHLLCMRAVNDNVEKKKNSANGCDKLDRTYDKRVKFITIIFVVP